MVTLTAELINMELGKWESNQVTKKSETAGKGSRFQ